jgi:glycosyltransferase involved in cell wall biosynthesis
MPLVSIVTPVYDEARHLPACIESIIQQTYTNWDYTILDNCSTDGSLEIARHYAAKDARINVLSNDRFLPAITNHNAALRQISPNSVYCKMVLADDLILPDCLRQMVALAERNPSVAVVGAYAVEGKKIMWDGLPFPNECFTGRDVCRSHLLDGLYVFGTANSVLYRADLVRGRTPFYNEANIHADTEVCFALLDRADFGFVHQVLSYTRVRQSSLSALSSHMHTDMAGMLTVLLTYGRTYLSQKEFDARLNRHLCQYYRLLAKSLLARRDRRFWEYHERVLSAHGLPLSRPRLMGAVLKYVLTVASNPGDSMEKIRRWAAGSRAFDGEVSLRHLGDMTK